MSEPKGQILPGSPFGDVLTWLARKARCIVEVGTWRGEGSTRCLANGVKQPGQLLWTIELDLDRAAEAKVLYARNPKVIVLQGRTLDWLAVLPAYIDLLLLDGGIEESFEELQALAARCQIIALDDTEDPKNRMSRTFLLTAGWHVLHDNPTDRNGWAVFERPASTTKGTT